VEMAHDKGLLSSPEYGVMCQWYEYIETNVDIGLDLIGKNYTLIIPILKQLFTNYSAINNSQSSLKLVSTVNPSIGAYICNMTRLV